MIRFDSVSKRYRGATRPAVDGISLEIGASEFVFLVGASGSGKSTLLRLMLREEKPSVGEIHVLGQRLTSISTRKVPYFRRSLGVVFQDFRLLPNKTVYENVAFSLQVIGRSRGFIQTTVPDVLETVGLADKSKNLPNELSGGEQQRVAIARAVVNRPSILLADEPTGNLDPRTSDGIMQVLERINAQGTTVVMATHDVTIVDRMQKRVVELVDGRIIRDELEATYVTSSIRLPKPPPAVPAPAPSGGTPRWARRATDAAEPAGSSGAPAAAASVDAVPSATGPSATGPSTAGVPIRASDPGTTGSVAKPTTGPIWVRSDTGPVLVPGEHAPWRAKPLAPPEPKGDDDGRSLFFAAPVPAPRSTRDTGTGSVPAGNRAEEPQRQTPAAVPDLENTGDAEAAALARHRIPLPDHLDFVTGLGLRAKRGADDEVGPSS